MTIGKKILATSAFLVGFSLLIGLVSANRIGLIQSNLAAILNDSLPGVARIGMAAALTEEIRGNIWKHISSDASGKAAAQESIATLSSQFGKTMKEYERTITAVRDRELFVRIQPLFNEFMTEWQAAAAPSWEGRTLDAVNMCKDRVGPSFYRLKQALADEVAFNRDQAAANSEASKNAVAVARFWIWSLIAASACIGGALATLIVRNVNRTLVHVAAELSEAADHVAAAAGQVASSSQVLAHGASEQAASAEETSASTEEITSMTRKNAESARTASELMLKAVEVVEAVNRAHRELGESIDQVNKSGDKVSQIIKAIDEIAFQTNILALNAAVEAARAGEAGQGFAVVADEVRSLARRSADAAKETAALIQESINRAREGKQKLSQVLTAMEANNRIAIDVRTSVDEVSLGSQEQTRGLEQIAKAVVQMDQAIQQAAASAEESASAGEELTSQAEAMRASVKRLRNLVQSA